LWHVVAIEHISLWNFIGHASCVSLSAGWLNSSCQLLLLLLLIPALLTEVVVVVVAFAFSPWLLPFSSALILALIAHINVARNYGP